MATLDPLHPVQSAVIESLSEQQNLSVKELHSHLTDNLGLKVSSQNLYRLISMLSKNKVVSKEKGKLMLNLEWVSHFLHISDSIKINYSGKESVLEKLPQQDGDSAVFVADSLMGLDLVWINILIRFAELTQDQDWYAYNSHPWYAIGTLDTEKRFFERLTLRGLKISMLYGNDFFLDLYGKKLIEIAGFSTTIAPKTNFPTEGYAIWVCGDYILEVQFPDEVAKHFAYFFQNVTSMSQFDPKMFSELFKMKAKCSLKVELNKRKAEKKKKEIKKYFELNQC